MKPFLFLFILFSSFCLQAQNKDTLTNHFFIYNNGKDTIHFNKMNTHGFCTQFSTIIKDSIQIDGKGSKELVFYRSYFCQVSEHGGTFDIDENTSLSKYEIWNLDTKEMLFETITLYSSNFNRFEAYRSPSHLKGSEFYSCSFTIDSLGVISISNFKSNNDIKEVKWSTIKKKGKEETVVEELPYNSPFHGSQTIKEGTYHFIDGEYLLK